MIFDAKITPLFRKTGQILWVFLEEAIPDILSHICCANSQLAGYGTIAFFRTKD